MKKDPETLNRFAKRAKADFTGALIGLVRTAPLERITVQQLCDAAGYPRSTFYNHFEDIYDLLDECWESMYEDLSLDDYRQVAPRDRAAFLFGRVWDLLDANRETLDAIMARNAQDGALARSFEACIRRHAQLVMADCPVQMDHNLPDALLCEHYANTVVLVISWGFLRKERLTRDEALAAIGHLLEGV